MLDMMQNIWIFLAWNQQHLLLQFLSGSIFYERLEVWCPQVALKKPAPEKRIHTFLKFEYEYTILSAP